MASRLRSVLLPVLAVAPAFAILIGLGTWQLQRKAWKEELIGRIEARAHGEPAALPAEADWPRWMPETGEYARVRVTGTYLPQAEIAVHGLAPGEGPGRPLSGFYLLTPLRLPDGALVVVNRGFVVPGLRAEANPPSGQVIVTGLLRGPEQGGAFTPANDPARGEWYRRDPAAIAAARGLDRVAPFILDAEASATPASGWPRAGLTRLDLPNRHLEYAFTWFGLAATLLAVATFAIVARRRKDG